MCRRFKAKRNQCHFLTSISKLLKCAIVRCAMINKILPLFLITLIGITTISCDKNEDIQIKELAGNWIWTSSCGGFSGACIYPDRENFKSIEITNEKIIEKINGIIITDETYEITNMSISDTNYPFEKNYELTLGEGRILSMTLLQKQNRLSIFNSSGIMLVDNYKGL